MSLLPNYKAILSRIQTHTYTHCFILLSAKTRHTGRSCQNTIFAVTFAHDQNLTVSISWPWLIHTQLGFCEFVNSG